MSKDDHPATQDRLFEALSQLTDGEKQILEAWMRSSPQPFDGTSKTVIDQVLDQTSRLIEAEKQRTRELMEQSMTSENVLKQSAQQREALIRQFLAAKQAPATGRDSAAVGPVDNEALQNSIKAHVKDAISEQIHGLIQQIEDALAKLGDPQVPGSGH